MHVFDIYLAIFHPILMANKDEKFQGDGLKDPGSGIRDPGSGIRDPGSDQGKTERWGQVVEGARFVPSRRAGSASSVKTA